MKTRRREDDHGLHPPYGGHGWERGDLGFNPVGFFSYQCPSVKSVAKSVLLAARLRVVGFLAAAVLVAHAWAGQLWWERGADKWCYKDDWRGSVLSGARSYSRAIEVPDGAASGWIVVWGDRGYALSVNGKAVGSSVDGGLIDDYDLSPFLGGEPKSVTIRIEGSSVCAEGELVGRDAKRHAFATGEDWEAAGGKVRAKRKEAEPSTGAFHRAHNGRLLIYNDEERGKTAIAKALARIQRLNEQGIFVMRRLRPAEEIVSFDPETPWRRAERLAAPLVEKARALLREKAIPAQKAGRFADALATAGGAAKLIEDAQAAVTAARSLYRAKRWLAHDVDSRALFDGLSLPGPPGAPQGPERGRGFAAAVMQAITLAADAHARGEWAACQALEKLPELSPLRRDVENLIVQPHGICLEHADALDEFPHDRFAWLNARDLIGNDPVNWPFSVSPTNCAWVDLAGRWEFRTDPKNEGEKQAWHLPSENGGGWRTLFVPMPWERQGVVEDNLNSPGDCPYRLADARCGDKPYNGFAWYRRRVFLPASWRGRRVILATGRVHNWGRVFVNGRPLGEGRLDPPAQQEVPSDLLRPGELNTMVVQVYNHDNFGGIEAGPVALYAEGSAPEVRETPGPLSYARELSYPTPDGPVRMALLASAMSPAVVVATDAPSLSFWGWEAKGYRPPSFLGFARKEGSAKVPLGPAGDQAVVGSILGENWLHLGGGDADALVVLERAPKTLAWRKSPQGGMGLTVACEEGPVRAAILAMPAGVHLNETECRFWARALRRYPVAASELVRWKSEDGRLAPRTCSIRYNYLELGGFGLEPLTVAPVPMLFSYGLEHKHPGLRIANAKVTSYRSRYAPYRVVEGADTVEYVIPALDRTRVMKGVGELFARRKAEHNARGGVSEDEMFRRMGEWGFDHCRYAWAFQADWDLPLVKFVGGPVLEDNEACWKRLDELVAKCNQAGMQMMLCWFFNEDQPQKDTGGAVRNSTRYWRAHPEAQKNAFELWRRIAARYAHLPEWAVSYDFFNEPAYMNTDHWNEIVQELTKVIRSVDKTHRIVWESADGWAQPQWCLWMQPAKDPNVLYSFHHYGRHWGYAQDEYYPSYACTTERSHMDPWLEAILFAIQHNVPIHCGEFGLSMIQPEGSGEAWLEDYLAFFERFGIGWNWWNYAGDNIYRTGLAAGDRLSPLLAILRRWMERSGWGAARKAQRR